MNIYILLPLITLIISIGLGLFVFIKARKRRARGTFSAMCFCLAGINLSYLMISLDILPDMTLFWPRLLSLGKGVLVPTFFYFALLLTHRKDLIEEKYHLLVYYVSSVFMLIEIIQMKGVTLYPWGYIAKATPISPIYHTLLGLIVLTSLYLLYKGSILLPIKRERIVVRYLFWGGLVSSVSLIVNLLPLYGLRIYHFGHLAFTLYLIIIAFTILEYHSIGIEVTFRETLLFSLMTGSVMAILMVSLSLLEREGLMGVLSPAIVASIVTAFVFQPLRDKANLLVDRLFFSRVHRREAMLHGLRQSLTSILDSDLLLDYLSDVLKKTMGIERISILLPDDGDNYRVKITSELLRQGESDILKGDDPIIDSLQRCGILHDYKLENEPSLMDSDASREFFARLGAVILIPIIARERLLAILSLGEKDSGLTYTSEEIEFLRTVSKEAAIAFENIRLFGNIRSQLLGVARALVTALESKDVRNYGHADRVAEFSGQIAARMGLSQKRVTDIRTGASLHDIGKINIPDKILQKPLPLTQEEWERVKLHPQQGYEIISPVRFSEDVLGAIRYHHEKFDGSGYPYGHKGEEISIAGRIVACANAYDAMTSDRPYRLAISKEEAIVNIRIGSGEWFDPNVVETFIQVLEEDRSQMTDDRIW